MNLFRLKEYPDLHVCKNILNHPDIPPELYERLESYCKVALEKGCVEVDYKKKFGFGRLYANNQYSCTTMKKVLRSTFFQQHEYDIDIVSAHPSILLYLAERYVKDVSCDSLKTYVLNRESILQTHFVDVPKEQAKCLFNIIVYGGTIQTWKKEYNINDNIPIPNFVRDFQEEIQLLTAVMIKKDEFRNIVIGFNKYKKAKLREKFKSDYNDEKVNITKGAMLSAILQEYETIMVSKVIDLLQHKGVCVTAYCYDGFQVTKETWKDEYFTDIDIEMAEYKYIKFIKKPFAEPLDINDALKPQYFDHKKFQELKNYKECKAYFERFHFMIFNPPSYVRKHGNESPQVIPIKKFKDMFEHLKFLKDNKKESFIRAWCNDENKKAYEGICCCPPPQKTKYNHYNTWTGFPIEQTPLDMTADTSRLYKHLGYVSNHDELVKDYLINWLADILQNPGKKSKVAVLVQGEQGGGKSIVGEYFLRKIIGLDKMIITEKIGHLVGRFSNSVGVLLTTLNETSGKDTCQIDNLLKDYITKENTKIETKNVDAYNAVVCDRLWATTNSHNALPFKGYEQDRRWVITEIDSSMKNNMEYFDPLYNDLDDTRVMRKFYEELKTRDISKWNPVMDRPRTSLADHMAECNQDMYDLFIERMRMNRENITRSEPIEGDLLYSEFCEWYREENRPQHQIPTRTKFGTTIKVKKYVHWRKSFGCIVYWFQEMK